MRFELISLVAYENLSLARMAPGLTQALDLFDTWNFQYEASAQSSVLESGLEWVHDLAQRGA